jgi:adenylosuccinate lyase
MLTAARDQVIVPALRGLSASWKPWPRAGCPAHAVAHARPTGQPDHARQGIRQRRARLGARSTNRRVQPLGKMNGAVGNFNAHMSAYPEVDWEAFSAAKCSNSVWA